MVAPPICCARASSSTLLPGRRWRRRGSWELCVSLLWNNLTAASVSSTSVEVAELRRLLGLRFVGLLCGFLFRWLDPPGCSECLCLVDPAGAFRSALTALVVEFACGGVALARAAATFGPFAAPAWPSSRWRVRRHRRVRGLGVLWFGSRLPVMCRYSSTATTSLPVRWLYRALDRSLPVRETSRSPQGLGSFGCEAAAAAAARLRLVLVEDGGWCSLDRIVFSGFWGCCVLLLFPYE